MAKENKSILGWLLFFAIIVAIVLGGLLASDIVNRRVEAKVAYRPVKPLKQFEPRNEEFIKQYPLEGETWKETAKKDFKSKHNGNVDIDMLEVDPRLVILWAGYGFSKGYNQSKGHFYAIDDIHKIQRTGAPMKKGDGPMPATCWTCKSPDVPRLMNELGKDGKDGVAEFYKGKWFDKGEEIVNPIGCADCHNPETMELAISRPALVEAFQRQGKDINDATHNEMRSLVCAQCHVEYYFDKKVKPGSPYLTFPWDKGMSVEAMEEYYDEIKFKDWTHKISKAPMLKAQHPGYEVHLQGIHGKRGVSCADCHMPYKTQGAVKFSDHRIQSPLNNIANSCQVCHRESAEELKANVYSNQDKVIDVRDQLEILLVKAHLEAGKAWEVGAKEEQMKDILQDIRHAQWRWDYAAASHGASFHAPVEITRVISTGIQRAQEARIKLAKLLPKLGFDGEVPYPDISTKDKAQRFIGLDPDKMKADKKKFLETIVPEWNKRAAEREAKYDSK
ncbi:MAG: ammonia-forming cytochrome c nitrite reductase [Fibrobacterales bacterium]